MLATMVVASATVTATAATAAFPVTSRLPVHRTAGGDATPSTSVLPVPIVAERQEEDPPPPGGLDPIATIPAGTFPVCNGPQPRPGPYGPTLRAWQATLFDNCAVAQPELLRRCELTSFMCCSDAVPTFNGISGAGIMCDLASGLCDVRLLSPPGRILIGSRRSIGCGSLQGADGSLECACRTERAEEGGWPFPAPCVVLLPSSGLVDPVTGAASVSSITFGPYLLRNLTTPRAPEVNLPGEEPRVCVPARTARVPTCDAPTAARAAVVLDACMVRRGFRTSLGRPGECCAAIVEGSPSIIHCIFGGDCVRVSTDRTRFAVVANDWAPATGGGCHGPGGIRSPPGVKPDQLRLCAPPVGTPLTPEAGGCVVTASPAPSEGCSEVDTAAGGTVRGAPFVPALAKCAT